MTRPADLKPAHELASKYEHGTRMRYMGGCKCFHCRRANSDYERERQKARAAGDWNGYVPADKARAHMAALAGWRRETTTSRVSASLGTRLATEVLWINPAADAALAATAQQPCLLKATEQNEVRE